jgi:hypothetical protein
VGWEIKISERYKATKPLIDNAESVALLDFYCVITPPPVPLSPDGSHNSPIQNLQM